MGLRIEDFPPKGCSEELEKWNIILGEFAHRFKTYNRERSKEENQRTNKTSTIRSSQSISFDVYKVCFDLTLDWTRVNELD